LFAVAPAQYSRVVPAQAGTQHNLQMSRQPCVYILASKRNGTLYTGVTSDVAQRVWQHRNGEASSFTRKYGCNLLVYVELHETMEDAIVREKRIKEWQRAWKLRLIEEANPEWRDHYDDICR
jgi:putative endonuclease